MSASKLTLFRNGDAQVKIGFITERRYLSQNMPGAVIEVLRAREIGVDVICPEGCCFEPASGTLRCENGVQRNLNDYDLIVSRNRNALGLAILAYADVAGIPAINTHTSTQRVRNKAKMAGALCRAGVRCAPTVLASDVSVLTELPQDWFPLILKATYGDNSQGLRLVRCREDLCNLHWGDDLVLAQHYLPNNGFDLKLYAFGSRVFAMHKPSPFNGNPNASAQVVQPSALMIDLAQQCGEIFGLDIYGVDVIETTDGLAVIEVNEFPNFTGVPGAAEYIADYMLARVDGKGGVTSADRFSPARLLRQ